LTVHGVRSVYALRKNLLEWLYKERRDGMLEKATALLNAVAALAIMATGLYVVTAFSDVISPSAEALIGMVVMVYSYKQVDVFANRVNKN
jgi:hypothetical protein